MVLTIVHSLGDLPASVKDKLESANAHYSPQFEQYILAEKSEPVYIFNDQLVQVLALHKIKGFFCTASLPCEPHWLIQEQPLSALQSFLDELVVVLKKQLAIDWVSVTPACSLFLAYPNCSERIGFGNYIIDLTAEEDTLFSNMESKHRNMVRRGERSGVEVRFGGVELLEDYISLDKQTWERSGQTIDHTAYYKQYIATLSPNVTVGVAYKDGVPQCGLIGLYNRQMFYYMFGASAHRPEPGSTHYLQWKNILKMKEAGVKAYSFVGCRLNEDKNSKYHNIQHFKKGFGGELRECYLFRVTLNKAKKWLFDTLMRVRTGAVPQDVIDQEKHKWTELNN